MTVLVTGGAGFIGSNFVLDWLRERDEDLVNVDKLTYAGNLHNLAEVARHPRHHFVRGDIADSALIDSLLARHDVRAIVHFAAESHVDRSIHGPGSFIDTNIVGTYRLLESARAWWTRLTPERQAGFRYVQVSTDEVFGSLTPADAPFTESHRFEPNSPYSASKAAGDHLVRAWHHTFGLPVVTTHCSNNYGPFHFPEKLIPLCLHRALQGAELPIYGDGQQVRDWLYVGDHCSALRRVLDAAAPGSTWNIGGWNELPNLEVVRTLCALLDELSPRADGESYTTQIRFVADRPGHDRRYAIDARKLERELGWRPAHSFASGLRHTVRWYLDHPEWVAAVTSGAYRDWVGLQYGA